MSAIVLIFSFVLLSFAISLNNGSFNGNLAQIILIFISYILLFVPFLQTKKSSTDPLPYGESALFAILILFALIPGGWWLNNKNFISLIQICASILLIPLIFLIFNRKFTPKNGFIILIFFLFYAFILRMFMILGSPAPGIDVFIILREAPLKLLQGINPYNTLYTHVFPGITPDYFAYWPASFLLELPFVTLFNDPRVIMIFADLGAAVLLFLLGGTNRFSLIISLLYLFRPLSLSIIEASWLTPLNFFIITLIAFVVYRKKNPFLAGLLLGLLTSIQFFFTLLFFYLGKFFKWNPKFIFSFLITTLLFVFPFFITNPIRFISQTIAVYFRNPPHPSILIHTSLSLNSLYFFYTQTDLPQLLIWGLSFLVFLTTLIKKGFQNLPFLGFCLTLFSVFVFGRQAFINYFYFIASLLLLNLVILENENNKKY